MQEAPTVIGCGSLYGLPMRFHCGLPCFSCHALSRDFLITLMTKENSPHDVRIVNQYIIGTHEIDSVFVAILKVPFNDSANLKI
jgi:hypothetical protein